VGDNDENVTNLLAQAYNKFARYGNLSSFTCMEDVLAMASSQREILWKRTLRPDMKGQDVAALQRRLAELRYYTGECDGVYGLLTKGAVFDFQKAHRLRVDGIAGKEVFSLLKSGLEREKIEHIVTKGETLAGIAGKHKVPQELLVTANSLRTEKVEEGDSLMIPVLRLFGFCSPPVPGEPVCSHEYVLPFLTAIAPRWFFVDEHGDIQGAPDKRLAALAQMTGVELWPVVSIARPGPREDGVEIRDPLDNVLSDSLAYSKAIKGLSALATRMRTKGFIISAGTIHEKDVYAFQSFLRKIRNALKQEGLMLAVEVPLPEDAVSCQGQDRRKGIQDLEGIASVVHLVFLKAYKDPWEFTSPEPIVSINRCRTALKSLARALDFWKTIVVMPAFGVDFSSGLGTTPLRKRHREIMEIMELFKPTVSQPDGEKSKVFRYRSFRVSHTVYFEDAESIGTYADLAQRYGVAGIAIADLEDVDPWVWSTLKARFKVVKDGGGDRGFK
jgi:spore germination protein YaaH